MKNLNITDEEIKKGDVVLVICENHKKHYGCLMFCIGINRHGFIQLSHKINARVADIYLGKTQCKKVT